MQLRSISSLTTRRSSSGTGSQIRGYQVSDLLVRDRELAEAGDRNLRFLPQAHGLLVLLARGLTQWPSVHDLGRSILHFQTGRFPHLTAISRGVRAAAPVGYGLYVVGDGTEVARQAPEVIRNFDICDVLTLTREVFLHRMRLSPLADRPPLGLTLRVSLLRQLLLAVSVERFMSAQRSLVIVTADFDRGSFSGVWFAVSKKLGMETASFQHGLIVPAAVQSGFAPLVAHYICVWGECARQQLESEGVPGERIVVVGNPGLDEIEETTASPDETIPSSLAAGGLVWLALSTPDRVKDELLVRHFVNLIESVDLEGLTFAVKPHPGRQLETYEWIPRIYGLPLIPREFPREELYRRTAAVVVTDSTMGIEMLHRGVPVGVFALPGVPLGYGQAYIDFLQRPVIDTPSKLRALVANHYPIRHEAVEAALGTAPGDRIAQFFRGLLPAEPRSSP